MSKPQITGMRVDFMQDGNTMGTTSKLEQLTVEMEFQALQEDGGFLVLRTETGWSIDDPEELTELLERVLKMVAQ